MAEAFDLASQVLELIKAVEGSKTALQYHEQRLAKLEATDLRLETAGLAQRLGAVEGALGWLKWLCGALLLAFLLWLAGQAYEVWRKSQPPFPILRRSASHVVPLVWPDGDRPSMDSVSAQ